MTTARTEYNEIRIKESNNREFYFKGNGLAAPPHTVNLSVNNNCFMRCKMCDIGTSNKNKGVKLKAGHFSNRYIKENKYIGFPFERIKELVDEVAPYKPIIRTNFVEPLIYKNLQDLALYVKEKGLKFYTITNGWLLKKNANWLVDTEINLIRISLDGTETIHDNIRGIKGSFSKTIAGIKKLITQKKRHNKKFPIIGICYTISNHNFFNLSDFMDYLNTANILSEVYVNFNHLLYTTQWEVDKTKKESCLFTDLRKCSTENITLSEIDIKILKSQINKLYRQYDQVNYHYYFTPWLHDTDLKDYYSFDKLMFPHTPCYVPWYTAQIEIDGNVGTAGHCILPSYGNIFSNTFMEVWNSEDAIQIRMELKKAGSFTACNKCIGTLYPLRGRA